MQDSETIQLEGAATQDYAPPDSDLRLQSVHEAPKPSLWQEAVIGLSTMLAVWLGY